MISSIREQYNREFTQEKYQQFLQAINQPFERPISFRVAESPVFFDLRFKELLRSAGEEIVDFLVTAPLHQLTKDAIPKALLVPNETAHTHFLALDFAVCMDENAQPFPQLIELQGFPSLFAFQYFIGEQYKMHFYCPEGFSHYFSKEAKNSYLSTFKNILLNGHDPKHVVLLEVEPEKQSTYVDFALTEKYTGVKPICISKVVRKGTKLFYHSNGELVEIKRIYNRVIFDEFLKRTDLTCAFNLVEDVEVEWAGHPNWFFRISKFLMPFLKSVFVPECKLLSQYENWPEDLENYVLKPLFSFSGTGVKFHVNKADLEHIPKDDYPQYMLQRKVQYEPILQAPDGKVKVEVRLLYFWEDHKERPELMVNLSRLSRGEMIGVKFNKDKTWVGGNVCFFEEG